VRVASNLTMGHAPLTVLFSSLGTFDHDGDELRYRWDFDANGRVDSKLPNPTFTYRRDGVYLAHLNVIDEHGRRASNYVTITVGSQ
jgi:cytochrome c